MSALFGNYLRKDKSTKSLNSNLIKRLIYAEIILKFRWKSGDYSCLHGNPFLLKHLMRIKRIRPECRVRNLVQTTVWMACHLNSIMSRLLFRSNAMWSEIPPSVPKCCVCVQTRYSSLVPKWCVCLNKISPVLMHWHTNFKLKCTPLILVLLEVTLITTIKGNRFSYSYLLILCAEYYTT